MFEFGHQIFFFFSQETSANLIVILQRLKNGDFFFSEKLVPPRE